MSEGWQPISADDPEAPAPDPDRLVKEPSPPPRQRSTRTPGRPRRPSGSRSRASESRPRTTPEAPRELTPEEGVRGVLQLGAGLVIVAGKRVGSVPLIADGATILVHGPGLAKALAALAENDPRVMALLEKVITFGPYGEALTAAFLMITQFGRNHGGPPEVLDALGTVEPEKIIAAAGVPLDVIETPTPSEDGHGASHV